LECMARRAGLWGSMAPETAAGLTSHIEGGRTVVAG